MKKKIIIWGIVAIIIFPNIPFINKEVLRIIDADHFRYSNTDALFTYVQSFNFKTGFIMREDTEGVIRRYINPGTDNIEIFRLYRINPLCFWRWSYYLISSRQFRYKSWNDIEPNRVPHIEDNPYQKF